MKNKANQLQGDKPNIAMRWRNIDAYRRSKIHTAGKTIVFRRPHELYCARVKVLCPHSKTISDQADRGCNGGPIGVAIIVRQQSSHSTLPQAVQMFSNTIRTLEGFLIGASPPLSGTL